MITEGEQNRLIHAHMGQALRIAEQYRGRNGVPFDELCSEALLHLVMAARQWKPTAKFSTYAHIRIHGGLQDFIDKWNRDIPPAVEYADEEHVYTGFGLRILHEKWRSLPIDPESLVELYDSFGSHVAAVEAALISLKKRDRKMIVDRFLADVPKDLGTVAREAGVSYKNASKIIKRSLSEMRKIVRRIIDSDRAAAPPPSRAPGQSALSPLARQKMSGG